MVIGGNMPEDDAEAAKWFRKAADLGVAQAQMLLASMYVTGQGVAQDIVQAHLWSILAAAQGNETAQGLLDSGADSLTPDQIAEAQRMAREWMAKHQR